VLLASLAEIGLSNRLVSSMADEGVVLVGAFVQKNSYDILRKPGLGRKSSQEAQEALGELGLSFGMNLHGWDDQLALDAREVLGRQLLKIIFSKLGGSWPSHDNLESELVALLSEVEGPRNVEILRMYFGFNERGPITLESVGELHGLTRERVRQIAERAERKLKGIWRPTPKLFQAIDILKHGFPTTFTAMQFSITLQQSEVSAQPFHVGGLLRAMEIIGEAHDIQRRAIGDVEYYGPDSKLLQTKELVRLLRKETSSCGCTSIQRLALMAGMEIEEATSVRSTFLPLPEVHWLDVDKNWLLSKRSSRNRLENVASKILSVAPKVELRELRSAMLRPNRVAFVPPVDVLSSLLKYTQIADVSDGLAIARPEVQGTPLGSADLGMALAFQELGSPLTREQLEEYCLDELGMNANSFYVYLSYSPMVVKLAIGVFGLVGEGVEVGRVEALKKEISASQFETSHGWSKAGTLWCHFLADRPVINAGARALPSFVQNMTSGEWSVYIDGNLRTGTAKIDNGFISGIRNALVALGASNGDFVQLDFKIDSRELIVRIVGDEPREFQHDASLDEFDEDILEDDEASTDTDVVTLSVPND